MKRTLSRLVSVAALVAALTGCASGTPSVTGSTGTAQRIAFDSYTPEDYAAILSGAYKQTPAHINGFLALPANASGKVPAVIIVPGSGGYDEWMATNFAQPLNDAGIATFIIDSFAGRGVGETSTDQGRVPMAASVMDGFAALKVLQGRPKIDADRIGVTGFSRGGVTAMFTAEKALQDAVGGLKFAAHAPFYPGCSTQFQKPREGPAPIRFFLGEKDDYTPASICTRYVEKLKATGAHVDAVVYKGAYHGWVSNAPVGRINVPTFGNCDLQITPTGMTVDQKSGADTSHGWNPFAQKVMSTCAGKGATYGANPEARQQAIADMVGFFRAAFRM